MSETNPPPPQHAESPLNVIPRVSFVVPVMDEQESLATLHSEITRVCASEDLDHEIIFIDDGSQDESWQAISDLVAQHAATQAIRFRRNFGKSDALSAGLAAARGSLVITMDADLQDDPNEIPRFLEKMAQGFDVVSGWKRVRHDPWHKVLPSRVFNWLVSTLTGVKLHDHNCGFKSYRREVFDEVELYGERHRFVPVLAAARGWKVGEIEVVHHARQFGRSKYGVSRLVKGFLDLLTIYLLTGFTSRPLHLIGAVGMVFFGAGASGLIYLTSIRLLSHLSETMPDVHLHQKAVFYYCILSLILGAQFLLAGLLAELIVSRTPGSNRPYSVAERIGAPTDGQNRGIDDSER